VAEIVINDQNFHQFLAPPTINGEGKSMGLMPRDFKSHPLGYAAGAGPFDLPLIPESEWQARLDAKLASGSLLSKVRDTGMNGQRIPSRDQDGVGCW
jgi:hypothetical protein